MKIPEPTDSTVKRIYASYEARANKRHSRRLGASQIGKPCDRQLWYSFYWAKKATFEGRMYRLFAKGNFEEAVIASDLKQIGVDFHATDDETGQQFEFSCLGDHAVVKLDGVCCGLVEAPATWHTCEFKTANKKAFEKLMKEGVAKAKPEHMDQMQMGMALAEIDRCLYLAVCKDDERIHMERIHFDKQAWNRILQRAKEIIFSPTPPDRQNESPAYFECKFCDYHDICHDCGEISEKNCRTCKNSVPLEDGGWACEPKKEVISHEFMQEAYDCHEYREGMVGKAVADACKTLEGKVIGVEGQGRKIVLDEENLSV